MSALLALLLAAGTGESVIEAERAFAEMAQTEGQWTAFRAFAADDAVLFTPDPVYADALLADLEDPAVSVRWWPARSFVSCDGATAVNTGPWVRPGNRYGYFVTVWRRQEDGSWRWLLDDGGDLDAPMAAGEEPEVRRASCEGDPPTRRRTAVYVGQPPSASGASADGTLRWNWRARSRANPDGPLLTIELFDGEAFETVLTHRTPEPRQ